MLGSPLEMSCQLTQRSTGPRQDRRTPLHVELKKHIRTRILVVFLFFFFSGLFILTIGSFLFFNYWIC